MTPHRRKQLLRANRRPLCGVLPVLHRLPADVVQDLIAEAIRERLAPWFAKAAVPASCVVKFPTAGELHELGPYTGVKP